MGGARVGLVGLGKMGAPMARNLLRAGFRVAGYDLVADAGRDLRTLDGFSRVESAAELSSALARSFATEGPMLIDACW